MPRPKIAAPVKLLTLHFLREGDDPAGEKRAVMLGALDELQPAVDQLMGTEPRPVPDSFRLFSSEPQGLGVTRVPSEYVVTIGGAPVPAAPPKAAKKKPGPPKGYKKPAAAPAAPANGTLPLMEPADAAPARPQKRSPRVPAPGA